MGSISTFGTFTMARLGVWAAQQSLNVTGNNISNVNTEGYSRQSISLYNIAATGADRYTSKFDVRISGGAVVDSIAQTRDQYLDIRYRDEMSNVGAMDAKLDGLNQIASIFDEVGRGEDGEGLLEAAFEYMVQQVETLSAQGAGMDEFDSMLRASAASFVELVRNRAGQLERLAENVDKGFRQDLDQVNSLLERIQGMNVSIRKSQVYGADALTQQDERNKLIDELSEYIKIDVSYEPEHLGENLYVDKLIIKTGGQPQRTLVDGIYATQFSIRQVEDTYADNVYNNQGKLIHVKGETIYQTDENGEYVLDGDGNKVPVMVDSPNYDLDMSELMDAYDRTYPVRTDLGALAVTTSYSITPTEGREEAASTSFETEEAATAVADVLNNSEAYYKGDDGKVYYYHVNKEPDDETGKWYIHQHDVTEKEDREDYRGTSFTYTSIGTNYTASPATTDAPATTFTTEDAAKAVIAQLPTAGKDTDRTSAAYGSLYEYEYSIEGNETDGYTIHQTQISRGAAELTDTELYGSIQSTREILTEKGVYATAEDKENDTNAATKRGIPFYQKALDTLANTFADLMNKANMLNDIADYTVSGKPIYNTDTQLYEYQTWDDYQALGYQKDDDGNVIAPDGTPTGETVESESGKNYILDPAGYRSAKIDDNGYYIRTEYAIENNYASGGVLFSNDGNGNGTYKITAANLAVSKSWANGSFRVLNSTRPDAASRESDNLNNILNILTGEHKYYPDMNDIDNNAASNQVFFTGSFQELLTTHIAGSLATDQNITETMLDNYEIKADELFVNRDAVMGVDLNDEAVSMMMYQKSYSAACRLMTIYDTMLDKLINGTA